MNNLIVMILSGGLLLVWLCIFLSVVISDNIYNYKMKLLRRRLYAEKLLENDENISDLMYHTEMLLKKEKDSKRREEIHKYVF